MQKNCKPWFASSAEGRYTLLYYTHARAQELKKEREEGVLSRKEIGIIGIINQEIIFLCTICAPIGLKWSSVYFSLRQATLQPSDAPAAPRPCRGGVAVGRGGVSIISQNSNITDPTPDPSPWGEGSGWRLALLWGVPWTKWKSRLENLIVAPGDKNGIARIGKIK